jgi:ABC-2 type transport system permease protein
VFRTSLVLLCSLPFFAVSFSNTSWSGLFAVMLVGSVSVVALGIFTGILPLLYPERGEQMSFMVQALVLLVSGVYYSTEVLPGWLHVLSVLSPATYLLRGIRAAVLDGQGVTDQAGTLAILAVFGLVMIPASLWTFSAAERWAKKTGRLKRHG